jgi:hypothetical protein
VSLGFDPGVNTGWAAATRTGGLLAAGVIKLQDQTAVQQCAILAAALAELQARFPHAYATVEDVTASAYVGAQSGVYRNPTTIATLNRVYGQLLAHAVLHWSDVLTVPVARWYPRQGGLMEKRDAVAYLRLAAGDQAKVLTNEHKAMAYGLARHGAMARRLRRTG